jgi:mannose-6-phosphate isomerase
MHTFTARPYIILGEIQNYAWGTRNDKAFIPRFLGQEVEPDKSYAELWIGVHPKSPAKIVIDDGAVPFDALIAEFPDEILGKAICDRFGPHLPLLFKVLSAGEALSIQAHPNKEQAVALHARDPEHYPDRNHKPEIAIALTDLIALAGFKPFSQLIRTFEGYPEIARFVGVEIVSAMKNAVSSSRDVQRTLVKKMYASLMTKSRTHKEDLLEAIATLSKRRSGKADSWTEAETYFFELREIYPGADSGLFSLFLLNLIHVKEGQALFLTSGIPHAYLRGDIVECMANSDNVVRAGLTAKFQDVETLLDILTYETGPVAIQEGSYSEGEFFYHTSASEFEISRLDLRPGHAIEKTTMSLHILLVADGKVQVDWKGGAETYRRGQSILLPAALRQYRIGTGSNARVFKVSIPKNTMLNH